MRKGIVIIVLLLQQLSVTARDIDGTKLFETLRTKVLSVRDYTAEVKMKINVNYMKIPPLAGTLYYKSPDKMRLERHGGLSILPKKNINLTLRNLIPNGNVMVIDVGNTTIGNRQVRILKVVPEDDNSGILLTKIWIDEADMVAVRTETTTRNDGTIIMDLEYAKYIPYSLPDKMTIHLDLKGYKLPKGVTMDYDDLPEAKVAKEAKDAKNQKGTIQISYLKYEINKGISDKVFEVDDREKKKSKE
jgi:outer membrane lipoprotein-sorting protein